MTINAMRVAEVLGGAGTLGAEVRSLGELRMSVETGLSVEALDAVVERVAPGSGYTSMQLKHAIVPKTTLRRRTRLTGDESQRLERMARMTALAEDVWESRALAHRFLTSPQPQLDGERPIDLARSDLGTRQVEDLLMKIEYALPA
jgi:putative toxin-antitoxin system antitoxin component (TIGR02293 family)